MRQKLEVNTIDPFQLELVDLLCKKGILVKFSQEKIKEEETYGVSHPLVSGDLLSSTLIIEPFLEKNKGNLGVEGYLNNHTAIENNIEEISKSHIGLCEDRKQWYKELKAAVKEYGHDEVLRSFYDWSIAQGSFVGRKPVSNFLRNISSNIGLSRSKPLVTNVSLDKVCERIAYVSNNKVFFTGDYRVKLAALLKDFGPQLITEAFEQFFQDVEEKSINWAARDFLQRASVMITIIQRKKAEAKAQEDLLAATYQQAKESVEEVQEEEEESL